MSKFVLGQRVKWTRIEEYGGEECPCCGSWKDDFRQVTTEHTVLSIEETHRMFGPSTFTYELSDEYCLIPEQALEAA